MNSEQENFEALRKLLALKKYENPPPGYFANLPGQIWKKIKREPAPSFWSQFIGNWGLHPAVAYSFGLLACGVLFFGIVATLKTESTQSIQSAQSIPRAVLTETAPVIPAKLATLDGVGMTLAPYRSPQFASTNPVMSSDPRSSLFSGLKLRTEQVEYSPGR
ncbi:MAG: hypothetical protein ABI042_07480 [Verrucomicrobiota bacterium]